MTRSSIAHRDVGVASIRLHDETRDLREQVRNFVSAELTAGRIRTHCDSWLGGWDFEFTKRLGERGWLGMSVPVSEGGHGRTPLERFVVIEELLAAGAPVSAHWVADRQTAPALLKYGSAKQRSAFIPRIVAGTCAVAIGMSEPDAGSDLAAVRTRATKVDGGWLVNGTKVWTSGAHHCQLLVLLCRTSGKDGDRHRGLSQLLVELPNPGVAIRPIHLMTGEHHFNEVVFSDAFIPDDRLLGEEGDGWSQVVSELGYERSGPERFLSTVPLLVELVRVAGDDSRTKAAVGSLVSQLWAIRQMSIGVATALSAGRSVDVDAAMVKDLGTRFETEVIEVVRLVAATEADPNGNRLQELLAEAVLHSPGFTLRGGTNEILRTIIGKEVGLS